MTTWLIEPRDPLVVRDGRPNAQQSQSRTLPFPPPSVLAGVVRTRLGSNGDGAFVLHAHAEALRGVPVRGPLLARVSSEPAGQPTPFVPAPRDCLIMDEDGVRQVRSLHPIVRAAGAMVDAELPGGLHPIGLDLEETIAGKPPLGLAAWWSWNDFERWIGAGRPSAGPQDGIEPLPHDGRVHVKLDEGLTAEEGMLFSTSGLCFSTKKTSKERLGSVEQYALLAGVDEEQVIDGEPRALRPGVGPFGGERRLVRWTNAARFSWPAVPKAVVEHLGSTAPMVRVRVHLLTPALFESGWEPRRLLESKGGVTPKLVGAIVPRPAVISGWDLTERKSKKGAKRTRRMVAAGSVYWIDLAGEGRARVAWANELWMQNCSDDPQDRRDGFGLATIGVG